MIKSNPCKECGSVFHTAMYHKPRKPLKRSYIKNKKPLKTSITPTTRGSRAKVSIKKKRNKTKTRSQLVRELDKVFSIYIRQRDKDNGCVTCGVIKPWQEMQNCHFYSRGKISTRWDETNCHSGCYRCNVLLKGNYIKYTIYMIDRYGREYVDELGRKANSNVKIPTPVIKDLIEEYKVKLLTLA